MLWTILDILLGTSFKKAGMGKEYRLAKTGVRYLYSQTNSSAGRSNSNSTKPITENQILEFKKFDASRSKLRFA